MTGDYSEWKGLERNPPVSDVSSTCVSVSNQDMRKTRWLFGAVIVVVAVLAGFFLYAHRLRKRAEWLLSEAYELSNYKGPITAAVLNERFGNSLKASHDCKPAFCAYEVVVTNRLLARLWLVPYTELRSQFWLRNGIVYENMLDYMTSVRGRYNVVAHAAIGFQDDPYFAVHPWDSAAPLESNGLAHVSAALSNSRKLTVLSLDTGCLTRIGGCTSIAELLPSVWQRTLNSQIKCVVPNNEGLVIAPADWPWVKGAAKQ